MKKQISVTRSSGNVFADIGLPDAKNLKESARRRIISNMLLERAVKAVTKLSDDEWEQLRRDEVKRRKAMQGLAARLRN